VVCIAFGARTAAPIPGITGEDKPDAIAVSAPDQLFVALWGKRQLVAIDLAAGTSSVLAELDMPVQLACDGRGALYVGGNDVTKIDLRTNERTVVATGRCDSLAVAPNGELYIGRGSTVSRVSPSGSITAIAGRPDNTALELGKLPGSIGRVRAMCTLHDGSLGVVDLDHGVVLRVRLAP
jgi:hypothetical protein